VAAARYAGMTTQFIDSIRCWRWGSGAPAQAMAQAWLASPKQNLKSRLLIWILPRFAVGFGRFRVL
jgi:hypothetical protein